MSLKKICIAVIAVLLCAATIVGMIALKNKKERDLLLQESISAFKAGDYQKAENGFKILKDKTDDPDFRTIYGFARTMQLWESEDIYDKLKAFEQTQYVNSNYNGLLADDIHMLNSVILEEGAILKAEADARAQEELLQRIKNGKPYVGMDVKYITMTSLGYYDDTGYNTKKIGNKDHRCTLYYWMDGNRCIFIARVQDDIGEVISISENPSGSYFGN